MKSIGDKRITIQLQEEEDISTEVVHKVTTCRKLARAQELIRLDKQQYWNKKKEAGKSNTSCYTKRYQVNEVDEAVSQQS